MAKPPAANVHELGERQQALEQQKQKRVEPDTFDVIFHPGDERERRLYSLLYQGFVTGGDSQQQKGIEVLRREVRILDKIEAAANDLLENGTPVLGEEGATLSFRFDEIALVRRYVTGVAWRTALARDALALFAKLGIPDEEK